MIGLSGLPLRSGVAVTLRLVTKSIERVLVDDAASSDEVRAVEEAFAASGFPVHIDPRYERRGAGVYPWVVSITLTVPIGAFLAAFAAEGGKDAYAAAKGWIRTVWAARRESVADHGSIELVDPEHTHLILATRITDEALDALATIDWDAVRGDYLVWDDARSEWRDPTRVDRS
jgi:hypothetical protein